MKIIVPLAGPNEDFIKNFNSLKPLTKVGNDYLIEKYLLSLPFTSYNIETRQISKTSS